MDLVEILSGTENGVTLGTPIALMVRNQDQKKFDYANTLNHPRPGHADFTYQVKYGVKASSGGGRASARETIGRVAAGAIAEKWLSEMFGTQISCWVSRVGDIAIPNDITQQFELHPPSKEEIEILGAVTTSNNDEKPQVTRCPCPETAKRMAARIAEVRDMQDSIGGVVTCVITGVPAGLGEPCFDKLEAELAKAMMSLPATKGFEIGEGFEGVSKLLGSQHNDRFVASVKDASGASCLASASNHAGGTLGGISSGQAIVFRVALKAVSSIGVEQETVLMDGTPATLAVKGRHDACVLPRVPPLIEGMAALVLADMCLIQRSRGLDLPVLPRGWLAGGNDLKTFMENGNKESQS